MNLILKLTITFIFIACLSLGSAEVFATGEKSISIGTAGVTGVYYPAGGATCRLINRSNKEHGIRCKVNSTGGSVYNLNAIKQGETELGMAQSDWVYSSYKGIDTFADLGPNPALRSLFMLHSEPFTVLVRKNSGIDTFDQVRGKRVNIGTPGSGTRGTMEKLMSKKGWRLSDFRAATELKLSELGKALCDNKVDVVLLTAGHPSRLVQDIINTCEVKLLAVEGQEIDELLKDNPYYTKVIIRGGMYASNPTDIKTFGVKAIMVANSTLSDETAYQVVKAVFDNIEDFKTLHPVFSNLDPTRMAQDAMVIPMHEGAKKYFLEKGLLPVRGQSGNAGTIEKH